MILLSKLKNLRNLILPISSLKEKIKIRNIVKFRGYGIQIRDCEFEGHNMLGANVKIRNSRIGRGTYINDNSNVSNASIGRFCSIADNLKIGFGSHPINMVSTFPSFYYNTTSTLNFTFALGSQTDYQIYKYANKERGVIVEVGNDVWIGSHVMIMDGVKVGTGAVIGAGAVVTKDIPPYAIVAGVPAKIIKYRHPQNVITELLESKWWDKPIEWLRLNKEEFLDVNKFLRNEFSENTSSSI